MFTLLFLPSFFWGCIEQSRAPSISVAALDGIFLSLLHPMPEVLKGSNISPWSALVQTPYWKVTSAMIPNSIYHWGCPTSPPEGSSGQKQWQHYLCHILLDHQFMSYFPIFHFRRRNAREVINDSSIINVLGSCNTRTLSPQMNWTSKTFYMLWFLKNQQQIFSWCVLFLFVCF